MLARHGRRAVRTSGLASLRRGRARAGAQGRRLPARRADPRRRTGSCRRPSSARPPCRPSRLSDGTKVVGSRPIMRELDARVPEPRLVARRSAGAARAEEWGDQVLQSLVRRVVWAALVRAPERVMGLHRGAKLPRPAAGRAAQRAADRARRATLNDASDPNVRADLRALPHHLDRVDGWIADGSLAEDAERGASSRSAPACGCCMTLEDVRAADRRAPGGPDGARRCSRSAPGSRRRGRAARRRWLPRPRAAGRRGGPRPRRRARRARRRRARRPGPRDRARARAAGRARSAGSSPRACGSVSRSEW